MAPSCWTDLLTGHRGFQDHLYWDGNRMRVWGAGGNFNVLLIPITLSRWESRYLILSVLVLLLYMRLLLYIRLRFKSCQQRKSSALLKLFDTFCYVFFLRHNHGVLIWAKFLLLLSAREQKTRTKPSAKMVASPMNSNYWMSKAILFQLELLTVLR